MHTKTIPSSPMEVNNNYGRDDEQNYMEMSPGIEYMKMSPPGNHDNGNWLKAFSVPIRDLFWWYCVWSYTRLSCYIKLILNYFLN